MKLNKLALVALLALGATACDKSDENDALTAGKKNVVLKLNGITSGSRGTGAPSEGTEKAIDLSKVTIFFAGGDNIYKVETLDNKATNWNALTGTGVEYHNLPKEVNAVYIVGNAKEDLTTVGSVATLKAKTLNVFDEQAMENITLFGEDTQLDPDTDTHTTPHSEELTMYRANVVLTPRVARIEIGNITCTDLGTDFKQLDLKVIGLLNFYEQVQLDGTTIPGSLIAADKVLEPKTGAQAGEGEYIFGEGDKKWGWDKFTASLTTNTTVFNPIVNDKEGKFVYNFIPNADLKVRMYLNATTVGGQLHPYNTLTAGFAPEGGFQPGYIYKVDLEFTEDNLKPWDPDAQICVNVSVTVKPWEIVSLDPVYE